jgi:hypothetical protein
VRAEVRKSKKVPRYPVCCQDTGRRDNLTRWEKFRHDFLYFSVIGANGVAGTPLANAAWKNSGVIPNFSILLCQVSKYLF